MILKLSSRSTNINNPGPMGVVIATRSNPDSVGVYVGAKEVFVFIYIILST